jgi:uncharacterized repeat protein (TIGR03987 family)
MKPILITGILIVNLALISYSVAIISEQRKKLVNNTILVFLIIGVIFDITATICMIIGSTHTALSTHGIFGYSALMAMLIDCLLLLRCRLKLGQNTEVKKNLHLYSRFAYTWWIISYITGTIIVVSRHL